ncbi:MULTISPECIES: hypothetical protein [Pectobacterium]|uniref:hypothetical protein n=1 Tax=Pectobacterium TaxID=122277 RepID=UPI001CF38BF4|nr:MULTISPECIES: hypothetical protein [Pectobacterium]MCA6939454.1 hypothetical protein [Pectobacterium versatile]MCQ8234185.1 hypothetical protein [Pectobacterium carotovorum]
MKKVNMSLMERYLLLLDRFVDKLDESGFSEAEIFFAYGSHIKVLILILDIFSSIFYSPQQNRSHELYLKPHRNWNVLQEHSDEKKGNAFVLFF